MSSPPVGLVQWLSDITSNPQQIDGQDVMARTTAPEAESVERTGPATMAKLPTDGTGSRLATVPDTTLEPSDGHDTRHILGQGNLDDTIPIKNAREGLVTTTGDRMDLTKRREEMFDHVVRYFRRAVTEIEEVTAGVNTYHTERDVTKANSRKDDAITNSGGLESDPHGTISQELNSSNRIFVNGLQQLRQDSRRPSRLIESWRKKTPPS